MKDECKKIIENAIKEDMPNGDITTDNIISDSSISTGKFIAKESGVLCGLEYAEYAFKVVGGEVSIKWNYSDSSYVEEGDVIGTITGKTKTILKGERVALNIMQRLSGIATTTREYVEAASGKCQILDTRKTTPNMRVMERFAVHCGGGTNHRFCLSDMVMIKDNHIDAAGSISEAVNKVYGKVKTKIEVEVETVAEFREALNTPCDVIMLDNMTRSMMAECVLINDHKKKLEASGNMTLDRIKEVSSLGVDYISVGALTHSPKSLDISLKFH